MKIIGFDTETTGVDIKTARILTAALVEQEPDGSFNCRELLLNPGVEVPEESTKIHGMTTEFVQKHGKDPKEALKKISKVLNGADKIVIYNASYDLPLLNEELKRYNLPPLNDGISRKVVDPLVIDRHYYRYRKGKRTLEVNADFYGVEVEGDLHEATTDVITTLKVLQEQEKRFPELLKMNPEKRFNNQAAWHKVFADGLNKWKGEVVVDTSWLDNRSLKQWHVTSGNKVEKCEAVYSCENDETWAHFATKADAEKYAEENEPECELDSDLFFLED